MTVNELIDHLKVLQDEGHGDKDVMFTYNYGDYWRTTVATTVDAGDVGLVKYSDYHSMNKVVDMSDDEGESPEAPKDAREVILLS